MITGYRTKREAIYAILKDEIYKGKYAFGEKLVISRLATEFGTSEIPVREALNQLRSENLIDIEPHVGAVIKPLSTKDIRNIFDLRIELEALATRLASEHLTDDDFITFSNIIEDSRTVFNDHDYKKYTELNREFHMSLYKKSDNELLVNTIEDLWLNSNRYPMVFNKNENYIRQSIQEHEDILNALQRRDGIEAKNIMLRHKARAAKEIIGLTQQNYYKV